MKVKVSRWKRHHNSKTGEHIDRFHYYGDADLSLGSKLEPVGGITTTAFLKPLLVLNIFQIAIEGKYIYLHGFPTGNNSDYFYVRCEPI